MPVSAEVQAVDSKVSFEKRTGSTALSDRWMRACSSPHVSLDSVLLVAVDDGGQQSGHIEACASLPVPGSPQMTSAQVMSQQY